MPRPPVWIPARRPRAAALAWLGAFALAAAALADPPASAAPPVVPAVDPLVLGTHDVTTAAVLDGDTIRIGEGTSVRILALDAEEVFHSPKDRGAASADFAAYAKAKRGTSPLPVKFATPAGEAAKAFVVDLVRSAPHVRLEKDAPRDRAVDTFGRMLAHVVLVRPEGEVLLAEAVIREGHSPYFVKYGRSRRFDARLRAAEAAARAAERGVWGRAAGPEHYTDYPERLAWWNARAEQIERWRAQPDSANRVTLGVPEESQRLEGLVGRSVVVFGDVRQILDRSGRRPWILVFSDMAGRDFRAVVFDPSVFASLDRSALTARYVTVRGTLTLYDGRPQVVVRSSEQIAFE